MPNSTVSNTAKSDPVRLPEKFGPATLKADTRRSEGRTVSQVLHDAVLKHYGSVKAAAFSLGEGARQAPLDPSLMQREFEAGKFHRLEHADELAKADIANALKEAFPGSDPKAIARRLLTEARKRIEEALEHIA